MVDRDKELTGMLDDENKPKIRAGNKEAKRKRLWLSEQVIIRRTDEEGFVPPNCEWKVERRKLKRKLIQELINRCELPCVVDYVYENTGAAVWMEDLQLKAQPYPAHYTIVPVVFRLPDDVKRDPKYDGDTAFLLCHVPNTCKDGETSVTEAMLSTWLMVAIGEVDRVAIRIRGEIGKIEAEKVEVERLIRKIPKLILNDGAGKPLEQAAADAERQVMYDMYGQAKYKIEMRIKNKHLDLKRQTELRQEQGVILELIETDKNTATSTWRVMFDNYTDGKEIEDALAEKDDWQSIRLAAALDYATPPVGPWAGRSAIPDGSKEYLPDYTNVVCNMSGVRVRRVPHGVGSVKSLDRASSSYTSDAFGYYTGEFMGGERHGSGIELDDVGIYSGDFEHGKRIGSGRVDLANGLTVTGSFGGPEQYPSWRHGEFVNPYLGGDCHGEMEVLFPDGGLYKGEMTEHSITGLGEYESAFGEKYIGQFVDGLLHGEGTYINHAGEEFSGRWTHGEMNGQGTYKNSFGDTYRGAFKHSLKHGRGHMKYKALGEYKGFWISDTRSGKAEMDFLPRVDADSGEIPELTESERRSGHEFKYRYQGYFICDHIMNGGIQLNTKMQVPYAISMRDKKGQKSIFKFNMKLEESLRKMKRKNAKMIDLELYMRHEIEIKKARIYRQQKHYTKKSMYEEDIEGLDHHELIQRRKARQNNLERLSDAHLKSSRALVPRLAIKDADPSVHLTKALRKIERHREIPINPDDDEQVDKAVLQSLVVSNFEEAVERQRFLKYDNIWGRAEKAFAEKRKKAAADLAEGNGVV